MLEIKIENIILVGKSIGTSPVSFLASRYKFAFVVLISPITELNDVFSIVYKKKLEEKGNYNELRKKRFETIRYLEGANCDVLINYGMKDSKIGIDRISEIQHSVNDNVNCEVYVFENMDEFCKGDDFNHWVVEPILTMVDQVKMNINSGIKNTRQRQIEIPQFFTREYLRRDITNPDKD